jgi:hypothetical protein
MFFGGFGGSPSHESEDVSTQTDLIYIDKSVGPDTSVTPLTPTLKKKVKYTLINIYLKLCELYENIQVLKNSLVPSD